MNKFRELFESKINIFKLKDDEVKLGYDSSIKKGVAKWVYHAKIRDVLESGTISKSAKKEVAKVAKQLGIGIDEDLWAIWSAIDKDATDEILHAVKSEGLILGGRERKRHYKKYR
jgi:hypothetical protein